MYPNIFLPLEEKNMIILTRILDDQRDYAINYKEVEQINLNFCLYTIKGVLHYISRSTDP